MKAAIEQMNKYTVEINLFTLAENKKRIVSVDVEAENSFEAFNKVYYTHQYGKKFPASDFQSTRWIVKEVKEVKEVKSFKEN